VMSRKVPIIILFVDMEGEGVQSTLDWFTEVAKENIHRFSFLYAGYTPPPPARVVNPHSPFPLHTRTQHTTHNTHNTQHTARTSTRAFLHWARAATSSRPLVTSHRLCAMPFSKCTAHLLRVVVRHNQWPSMLKLPRAGPSTSPRI
jgi:hypothetical protein